MQKKKYLFTNTMLISVEPQAEEMVVNNIPFGCLVNHFFLC